MEINLQELDIIFLSLDEPNADENYEKLLNQAHYAKRSHGIIGFDLAHRTAGNLSDTNFTITVDADTLIHDNFFNQIITWGNYHAISFNSVNLTNGLIYGNGGLKIWDTNFLKNMSSHEFSQNDEIDFCWDEKYIQLDKAFSWTCISGSPLQSWRSGFREGVKLSLDKGKIIDINLIKNERNFKMLQTWLSVGLDAKYGEYAMLGAHQGLLHRLKYPKEINIVKDYEQLKNMFNKINDPIKELNEKNIELQDLIKENIPLFNKEQSKWIKNYTGIYYK